MAFSLIMVKHLYVDSCSFSFTYKYLTLSSICMDLVPVWCALSPVQEEIMCDKCAFVGVTNK